MLKWRETESEREGGGESKGERGSDCVAVMSAFIKAVDTFQMGAKLSG